MSGHGTPEIVWLGLFVQFLFLVLFEVFSGSAISLQWFLFCVELLFVVFFRWSFICFLKAAIYCVYQVVCFFPFLGISYAWRWSFMCCNYISCLKSCFPEDFSYISSMSWLRWFVFKYHIHIVDGFSWIFREMNLSLLFLAK
jgi:hypothetical protein